MQRSTIPRVAQAPNGLHSPEGSGGSLVFVGVLFPLRPIGPIQGSPGRKPWGHGRKRKRSPGRGDSTPDGKALLARRPAGSGDGSAFPQGSLRSPWANPDISQ